MFRAHAVGVEMEDSSKQEDDMVGSPGSISRRDVVMWLMVLVVYTMLLGSIGYIAFWNQDFNNAKNTVGQYTDIIMEIESGEGADLDDEQLKLVIQESMKGSADSAGDLQELASQSFNIVLGAMLAFLSASTTMVFQRVNNRRDKPPS